MKQTIIAKKTNQQTRRFFWQQWLVVVVFIVSSVIYPISGTANALSSPSPSSASGLVIGSYNVSACLNGHNYKARMKTIAEHITNMGLNVVAMQEYNWRSCFGLLLSELNKLGGNWQESTQYKTDYSANQASVIWNANYVTKISDEIFDFDTPSNTDLGKPAHNDCSSCAGGSRYTHIVRLQDGSGKQFVVASGHFATGHSDATASHRVMEIRNLITKLQNETVPVFIAGDTNAAPTGSNASQDAAFYKAVADGGYLSAHKTAATVTNEKWATIGSSKSSANTIDQIFYRNVAGPSYYETLACTGFGGCATDHRPIKAIFDDLTGTGGNVNCYSQEQTSGQTSTNYYRIYNNIPFTSTTVCCLSATTLDGGLVGDTNAEKVYNFLISTPIQTNGGQPLSPAQAAGAVGNFMRESGGDTYNLKPDYTSPYGIVQWLGTRWTNPKAKKMTGLKEFAESKNTDWKELQTQVDFIIYELENTESAIIKDSAFQSVENTVAGARKAAERWDTLYERSGGGGIANRQDNAGGLFTEFGDGDLSDPEQEADTDQDTVEDISGDLSSDATASTAPPSASDCQAPVSSDYVFPLKGTKAAIRKWGNNPGDTTWKSGLYHEQVYAGYYAVDIMAPEGTEVVAFRAGEVIHSNYDSYGAYSIQIKDSDGYTYYYQHMDPYKKTVVTAGDKVEAGDLIGYVGNRQAAWGSSPHLHIDKSKNPGEGLRGTCTASRRYCPIADEKRFVKIIQELHDSYENLPETDITL